MNQLSFKIKMCILFTIVLFTICGLLLGFCGGTYMGNHFSLRGYDKLFEKSKVARNTYSHSVVPCDTYKEVTEINESEFNMYPYDYLGRTDNIFVREAEHDGKYTRDYLFATSDMSLRPHEFLRHYDGQVRKLGDNTSTSFGLITYEISTWQLYLDDQVGVFVVQYMQHDEPKYEIHIVNDAGHWVRFLPNAL